MAYVTQLKYGEGLKIGDQIFIMDSPRGCRLVIQDVDPETVIHKLTAHEVKSGRYRKNKALSNKEKERDTEGSEKSGE